MLIRAEVVAGVSPWEAMTDLRGKRASRSTEPRAIGGDLKNMVGDQGLEPWTSPV